MYGIEDFLSTELWIVCAATAVVWTFSLYWGMRLTGVDGTFLGAVVMALIGVSFSLIPYVGYYAAVFAVLFLMRRLTNAEDYDAALVVVVARFFSLVVGFYLAHIMKHTLRLP